MSVAEVVDKLEEITQELSSVVENMKTDDNDEIVSYYGELNPLVERLKSVIKELNTVKKK